MYNYNTVDGKLARIEELKKYINLIGEVPGDHISYQDARGICQYLIDIKKDLESQVAYVITKNRGIKRYRYHYVEEGIWIHADNGAEADAEYRKIRKEDPAGNIELTDMVTGEKSTIMKIDIGEPVKF